jgi:ArsR family transcriptional regulator
MTQSAVSHQLKLLRLSRLVKNRKEGTIVYYSLDDDHIQSLFKVALEHVTETP